MIDLVPLYFRYWGKADRDGLGFHLLPYHCLDVAAVGWVLLKPSNKICMRLAEQLRVKPAWLQAFFVFCLAIHDLGKFSTAFQGIKTNLSPYLAKANPRMRYTEHHDTLGFWLWREALSTQLEKLISSKTWFTSIEPWIEIVTGHHGMPPKKSGGLISNYFEKEDEKAACDFVCAVCNIFFSSFDHEPLLDNEIKKRLKTASWQLAGITVLADWLGSNQDHFKFFSKNVELIDYWHKVALPSAENAIRSLPLAPTISRYKNIDDLFPFIKTPTPLQLYAANESLVEKPQLFILEDVTGSGKTEAALILAHRLLSAGLADGLYVALPTMATANAMYRRLGKVYRQFYESGEEPPSLVLAHGARQLSDVFRNSVIIPHQKKDLNYTDSHDKKGEELSAAAYCNAWLSDSRKKALLADVGVGTLDQALLAVLPARHQSLRLFGLDRKVLLIDEVHAYDNYMQKLLDALLEIHSRQGGCAILLSATLPQTMRQNLVEAFHRGIGDNNTEISSNAYPLVTHSPAIGDPEQHIDTREEVKRTVTVKRLETEKAVIDQIRKAVGNGQCVCWIRNTVKAARKTHYDLANCEWMNKNHLHLFHSRFAMVDRQEIESDVLKRFGEKSTHDDRKGQVLIATQVVEQSLDLDFDVFITDLAPIDLIIQRVGRLLRHVRDSLGNRIRTPNAKDERGIPTLFLFSPDPEKDINANWLKSHQEGTQSVYPHVGRLWMTATLLLCAGKGKFTMPDDARNLIEGVYSPASEDFIPESLIDASMSAVCKSMTYKSLANLNALKLNKGYTRSSGDWDEETRIPTRLTEEETISVALAIFDHGKLRPYAKGDHHEWALSVIKLPEYEWQIAQSKIPTTMQPSIEALRAEVNALRWLEVFPLLDKTAHFYNARDGWQS